MVVGLKWSAVTSGAEMKQPLLGAMAGLAFAGSSLTAQAVPFDFTYTGSLVTFTVPTTDTYQILAFGAGRKQWLSWRHRRSRRRDRRRF
jgi:hypothetical protein